MRLSELARGVPGAAVRRGPDYEVERVLQDSREARPGDLFVALKGITVDGHDFAARAAQQGAAVALERDLELGDETAVLHLDRSRWGLGELAAELVGRPARTLRMAGVTGTDGKTTTTHLAAHVLNGSGIEAGYLSTIDFGLGASTRHNLSGHTTIESPALQQMLAGMREGGARAAVVEATSHALVQDRVAACDFDVAAVTNIGLDHLDYHHTWAAYAAAKAGLLELAAGSYAKGLPKTAVINRDDAGHETLARIPIERRWTYSLLHPGADLSADQVREFEGGSSFRLHTPVGSARVDLRLPARFNIYNALCAAGVGLALGADLDAVAQGLSSFPGLPGRLEPVAVGQPFRVLIDFAHSAGALASALAEVRRFAPGRLLLVFGASGRADHDRPGMGRAAAQGSDFFVITTDDPVHEDPVEIARQVQAGVGDREPGKDFEVILDRRRAIRRALALARPADTVLLAGKGHEQSMNFGSRREAWDERAEVEAALREMGFA